ncbi:t-SNARE coiled-coil homology domain-containing protein [Plasmodiophora brassicae]
MSWMVAAAVCILLSALCLSANAHPWSENDDEDIRYECAKSLLECTDAIVAAMKSTLVPEEQYGFITNQLKQAVTAFVDREDVVKDINTLKHVAEFLEPLWTALRNRRSSRKSIVENEGLLTHLKENIVNAVGEILNPGATTNPVDVRHAGPASSSRVGVKDTTKADATRVGISEDDEIDVGFHNAREEWDADEHWAPENPIEPGLTTVHDRETTLARSLANQQADPLTAFVSGSEATGQLATQVQGDQLEYRQTKDNAARGSDVAQAPSRGVDNGRLLDETIRKAQLHEQRALDLDEQVKRLLLDMHGTNASLQACQRDLADMQSRLDRASNDSRAAVSRRGNQVLGAGLLAAAATSVIGYGVGYRAAPIPGKDVPVSGQPERRSGIVSTVSTAIAGGVALKAFQSVAAVKASRSSTSAVTHPVGSPPDARVRPARDSSIVAYVLAGVCVTLIIIMVVSLVRFKRRLKDLQLASMKYADCVQCHHV